ncbi:hypothetical protein D3C72_1135670 [compost metagenome]
MPEVLGDIFKAKPKNDIGRAADAVILRILDAALERSEADNKVAYPNDFVAFDALLCDRDMVVDQVSRDCTVLLGNCENGKAWLGISIIDLIKQGVTVLFLPPRRLPKLRKTQLRHQRRCAFLLRSSCFCLTAHTR